MKSCPKCNRTYADETNYCLVDGSTLSAAYNFDIREQEIPTVIRRVPPSSTYKASVKTILLIFLLLAIPITLFPPYNWGEERLQTETDKNSVIVKGFEKDYRAKDVLPKKKYAFVFGNDKRKFKDYELGIVRSLLDRQKDDIVLQRSIIIGELILEYTIALLAAFIIQMIVQGLITWRKRK